jgi:hypothetical protein
VLWSAHVDWITTTWRAGAVDIGGGFATAQAEWAWRVLGVTRETLPLLHWAWQGYVGWSIGTLCFGERIDGTIVRVSGDLAGHYWRENRPTGHNVSRLDICCDVWWQEAPDAVIARHNVETIDARHFTKSRPWRVACVNGYGDGDTLYLGARASETYARIYNKGKESPDEEQYEGCTRYEVEFKDETARQIVGRMGSRRNDTGSLAQEVHSVLFRRGINVLGDLLASRAINPPISRIITPDERKLEWLRVQVGPTVKHLTSVFGYDTVLAALGLPSN